MTNDGIAWGFALRATTPHVALSFKNRQNPLFDVRCWTFDAYSPPLEDSTFISFYSLIRLAVLLARGSALLKLN